jgi:hypothetical protein
MEEEWIAGSSPHNGDDGKISRAWSIGRLQERRLRSVNVFFAFARVGG